MASKNTEHEGCAFGIDPEMWGERMTRGDTSDCRTDWFRMSRFGMFIHWGLYSELAGEWNGYSYHGIGEWLQFRARISAADYAKIASRFNPREYDPRAWVALAKAAGMRYIIITSKHHEGFALYKSAVSAFNIVDATPYGKDALAELAAACREADMPLGFYYSQTQDWHEPDAFGNNWEDIQAKRNFDRYLEQKVLPQIRELLTGYGKVAFLWFDTPGAIDAAQSQKILQTVRELQPDCLVNSRIGNNMGDYQSLGDQEIPATAHAGMWETIDTHNDTWGYVATDSCWKGPREILTRLLRVVAKGGCYMLNVGPDGAGVIPPLSADILREVGAWLQQHADAVYGAGLSPLGDFPWGTCTSNGARLFLHVFIWPPQGRLVVPGIFREKVNARMWSRQGGESLEVIPGENHIALNLPMHASSLLIPVIELECQQTPQPAPGVMVLEGYRNEFPASRAKLTEVECTKQSWMEKFGDWKHADCLTQWKRESVAEWRFKPLLSMRATIQIEYSSTFENGDTKWQLWIGSQKLEFPLIASGEDSTGIGGWPRRMRFRTIIAGTLQLNAEEQCLRLVPLEREANAVNITSVSIST